MKNYPTLLNKLEITKTRLLTALLLKCFKFKFWKDVGYFAFDLYYAFTKGELSITHKLGVITSIPKGDKPKRLLSGDQCFS